MIKLATRCKIPFILNNNTNLTCKSLQSIVSTKLARSLAFYFAKLKKEKPQLKVPTINISKFS